MYIRRFPVALTPIIYRISKKYHNTPLFYHQIPVKSGNFVQSITIAQWLALQYRFTTSVP